MERYIERKISQKRGNVFHHKYYDKRGNEVIDKETIDKAMNGLYVPPAYNNVKVSLNPKAKVRAIGYDTKCRPQYIYNKEHTQKQSDDKFNHMKIFGKVFPNINRSINNDLKRSEETKDKQIAMILKLIMECHFRVGSNKYLKDNNSYGTTTLRSKHLTLKKKTAVIDFIGKKKVRNVCTIKSKRLVNALRKVKKRSKTNDRIFRYTHNGKLHDVSPQDVNKYLKQFGDKVTTKNFRTWGANIEFIIQVLKSRNNTEIKNKTQIQKIIKDSITEVAFKLHNTPAVCKSNYLDPELIKYFKYDPEGFISMFYTRNSINRVNISKRYIHFLESFE